MSSPRTYRDTVHTTRRRFGLVGLLLLLPLLASCGIGDNERNRNHSIAWQPMTQPTPAQVAAAGAPGAATPEAVGGSGALLPLSAKQLRQYQPNELGRVPVLMYHAFTTDPDYLDEWTKTLDQFHADLQWLYDHNFTLIGMKDLLNNEIAVPPGRHPVVLTFDDSSAGQFRLLQLANGTMVAHPDSALGVLEAFAKEHPAFGRTAHMAVVSHNCLARDDSIATCEERLKWLVDHGYEVGNHTLNHENLDDRSDESFMQQVGGMYQWIGERVSGPLSQGQVLTLPFGEMPDATIHPDQVGMLRWGFSYAGEWVDIRAVLKVSGGPMYSPSSAMWDAWNITRFNTDPATIDYWFGKIERGEVPLYTSDGNPTTVTVPDPLPDTLAGELDAPLIASNGLTLVQYDPLTGHRTNPPAEAATPVAWRRDAAA
jgi:hypothetical protein